MEALPTKLNNSKLIDTIFQIKYDDSKESEILFAELYPLLSEDDFNYTRLETADLPQEFREKEPSLEFSAYYKFDKENLNILIGPKMISFTMTSPYTGWAEYKSFITEKLEKLEKILINRKVRQVSMRYINFFVTEDIFENINIVINDDFLGNGPQHFRKKSYNTAVECENQKFQLAVQINNKVSLLMELDKSEQIGSIIDLDLFTKTEIIASDIPIIIDELHKNIKNTFFNIISSEYLKNNLQPEY